MKRSIYQKYNDAVDANELVDQYDESVNSDLHAVHYPEMTDSLLNRYGKRVTKRKIRSVGHIKEQGKKLGRSWY